MERRHWFIVYWHWQAWEWGDDEFARTFDLSPSYVKGLRRAMLLDPGQREAWFCEDGMTPLTVFAYRFTWHYVLTFAIAGALFGLLF